VCVWYLAGEKQLLSKSSFLCCRNLFHSLLKNLSNQSGAGLVAKGIGA
jgi:hypothetical protein